MMEQKEQIWPYCQKGPNRSVCFKEQFLEKACQSFPIHLTKVVILHLDLLKPSFDRLLAKNDEKRIVKDDSEFQELDLSGPNVRVIYLTRDPRDIMHSRMTTVSWCKDHSVCSSTYKVCQDLNEEIKTAKELQKKFPEIFKILKYEDMAGFPEETFKELFTWLGLEFNNKMKEVVNSFTAEDNVRSNEARSVKKNSKARIARWKGRMKSEDIKEIEDACVNYMLENSYALSEMDNDLEEH
ncbi:unnamed protein product [Cyprideis torosa]|uniref:Sulfotransferase domain-containing protein n=1 Tax=Cyprideis torosa TaxID=163714 RepID=A0A7R8WQA5_9CRUS|nr:unnamed protein product [Cyprideis torosa]CAG0902715.1 unnamed protein product [Cyprideis torosa]